MFEQTFVDTHAPTRQPWTMAASLSLQIAVAAALLIAPLMNPEMLRVKLDIPVWVHLTPIATEVPREAKTASRAATLTAARPVVVFRAPAAIPSRIAMVSDPPQPGGMAALGPLAYGPSSGIPGVADSLPAYVEPVTPPPQVRKAELPKGPTHVSSGVQAAKLFFGPKPLYPALAKAARIQGTVRIQAVIALDGGIKNLAVVSGPPLLVSAAMNAVKQWRYQPTLLNGEPVEVSTEIEVNFTLSQ